VGILAALVVLELRVSFLRDFFKRLGGRHCALRQTRQGHAGQQQAGHCQRAETSGQVESFHWCPLCCWSGFSNGKRHLSHWFLCRGCHGLCTSSSTARVFQLKMIATTRNVTVAPVAQIAARKTGAWRPLVMAT